MSPKKKNESVAAKIAVIETGSKQYKVAAGDKIKIEKLEAKVGDKVNFDNVLLLSVAGAVKIGTPVLKGSKVVAEVISQGRHPKVTLFRYKAKERQRVYKGHKQPFTEVKITDIVEK